MPSHRIGREILVDLSTTYFGSLSSPLGIIEGGTVDSSHIYDSLAPPASYDTVARLDVTPKSNDLI